MSDELGYFFLIELEEKIASNQKGEKQFISISAFSYETIGQCKTIFQTDIQ